MRFEPGFVTTLREELVRLHPIIVDRIDRPGGLMLQRLLELVSQPQELPATIVENVFEKSMITHADFREPYVHQGVSSLVSGKVALCLLAGGSGTRIGGPKFMTRLPTVGLSLLALKMVQSTFVHESIQKSVSLPTWIMVSPSSRRAVEENLKSFAFWEPSRVKLFEQYESVRLTPDNRVVRDATGEPEVHPTGHGDLPNALVESGLLDANPQIEHVIIANVDNAAQVIDPSVIGMHVASGSSVTCMVVKRELKDAGGVIAWANGNMQIIENSLLPDCFEVESAPWHNTNTMIASIKAINDAATREWRWNRVRKQINNKLVVQYERFIGQLTEFYETSFAEVERSKRFLPVKNQEDLDRVDAILSGWAQ